MADIDALYQHIYGGGQGSPAPQAGGFNWERAVARLNTLADQYKVPRDLVHAVVTQESNWDPYAVGDGGQAKGWFQLHAGAAKDAGIDPRFRHEPDLNMLGGIRYLALKHKQAGGDWDKALRLYNGGGDPHYVANVRRHMGQGQGQPPAARPQSSGLLARVTTALSPASAEAATPASQGGTYTDADIAAAMQALSGIQPQQAPVADLERRFAPQTSNQSRLQEIEAELQRRDAQQAPGPSRQAGGDPHVRPRYEDIYGPTAPPGSSSPTWQEDIFGPPQAPAGSAAPPAEEPITPEARFLRLPSIQQMPFEARVQAFKDFYGLRPEFKEEFLRSEEPPSDLVIDIEKTSPDPQKPRTWSAAEWDRRMAPMQQQLENTSRSALPMAMSAVPGALAYQLGTKIAPALGAVGKVVPPLLEAAGGYLGRRANVALGQEQEGTAGDVMSLLPLATRSVGTAAGAWLKKVVADTPPEARDQLLGTLMSLFKRGGAQGALTYALSGDPQLAAWVGGSIATARSMLGFALRNPVGRQLVEQTLKAGRAIGGPELGALLHIGRTGKLPPDWGGITAPASESE